MTEELKEIGLKVGHRRVGRSPLIVCRQTTAGQPMRQNGISVVRTRKHKVTTIARQAITKQSAERGTAITSSTLRQTYWTEASQLTSQTKNWQATSPISEHVKAGSIWL